MENKLIYLGPKTDKNDWIFPDNFAVKIADNFEQVENSFIVVGKDDLEKINETVLRNNKVIADFYSGDCSPTFVRDLMIRGFFYVVLSNSEKNLESILKARGLNNEQNKQGFHGIIAESEKMQKIFSLIEKVSKTDATVLIRGESGTGKELVAKAIHNLSNRKNKPFVAVNCASIPENLLEAELFGHKKGAFTDAYRDRKGKFEEAHGGTLFLDEIGDMPLSLQAKILRALQEKEITPLGGNKSIKVDVRIISATAQNLEELIKKGLFREDLFYRLNVIPITLPPLRERKEDIPVLVNYFVKKYSEKHGVPVPRLENGALNFLNTLKWEGNVRELENFVEKTVVLLGNKKEITEKDLKEMV